MATLITGAFQGYQEHWYVDLQSLQICYNNFPHPGGYDSVRPSSISAHSLDRLPLLLSYTSLTDEAKNNILNLLK